MTAARTRPRWVDDAWCNMSTGEADQWRACRDQAVALMKANEDACLANADLRASQGSGPDAEAWVFRAAAFNQAAIDLSAMEPPA